MKEDKTVFLLVGPRGSGKSQYATKLLETHKELTVISRDEIIMRKFGTVHTDSHSGTAHYALEITIRLLRRKMATLNGKIVLDYWTGDSEDRRFMLSIIRECGATSVVALYFITPVKVVERWFWQKPGIARISEMKNRRNEDLVFFLDDTPRRHHKKFHKKAKNINSDGFDKIVRIDPREKPQSL